MGLHALAACLIALILGPAAAAADDLPDPARALEAHAVVRDWVRTWTPPAPDAESPLAAWGASVTLRLDGRVLARGSSFSLDGPEARAIPLAASRAIREARPRLEVPNDALAEERVAELGERVTVSLEIFGRPVPIPESELGLPMAGCSPGAEALVVSVAPGEGRERASAVSGVDAQLTRGADPARELSAMAAELTGDGATALRPVKELLDAGFRFARAPVIHLAMPYERGAPVFLDRGGRVHGVDEIRTAALLEMADGVAANLRARIWPGVERFGLSGDLRLTTGSPSQMVAPPFEQALVAVALLRHAQVRPGTEEGAASRAAAADILRDLGVVEPGEETPWDRPTTAAMCVVALSMLDDDTRAESSELQSLTARCLDVLRGSFDPTGAGFAETLPQGAQGLVAWALVRAGRLDDSFTRQRADAAVRTVYRETPRDRLVAQTPFVVWAELALHPSGELPSAALLDEMRTVVWDHQLRRSDLRSIDRDLAGGIVFTRGRSVLPTWQTMRPLAALATMMGDARLTPGSPVSGSVPGELLRVTESLRFVRQLAITGDARYLARIPERATWGVRPALWQPVASLEAGAMALLTTCEALDAMASIIARPTPTGDGAQPD
ncbi:MAG: hypothetical protein LAT64_10540 [Phycisphaerales bacterium]|nr:hypothetical protein [Planctomycetota bacterium]MCH8509189.1 hypothetical protein [Phycisphaerales bacterium]